LRGHIPARREAEYRLVPQGHVLLGDIYRQQKKRELAVSHYQAASQLKSTSPAPFLGLATLYWENLEVLRKVLELEPNNQQG
jgi:cytochrome c-type biogenesis protein CcmH/NrfG